MLLTALGVARCEPALRRRVAKVGGGAEEVRRDGSVALYALAAEEGEAHAPLVLRALRLLQAQTPHVKQTLSVLFSSWAEDNEAHLVED